MAKGMPNARIHTYVSACGTVSAAAAPTSNGTILSALNSRPKATVNPSMADMDMMLETIRRPPVCVYVYVCVCVIVCVFASDCVYV